MTPGEKIKEAADKYFKKLGGLYLIKNEMKEAVEIIFIAGAQFGRGLERAGILEMLRNDTADGDEWAEWLEKELEK